MRVGGEKLRPIRSAGGAEYVADMERIGLDCGATTRIAASGTQVMQPFQVAALTFPVAYGVVYKLKLTQSPKIGDWEYGIEHALQARVFPLSGKKVHLQKSLVGFLLDFDQVWDRNRSLDPREIHSFARCAFCQIFHFRSYGRWARNSIEEYITANVSSPGIMRRLRHACPGQKRTNKEQNPTGGI